MKNLTPHEITLSRADGSTVTFPPSGIIARVTSVEVVCGEAYCVPVVARSFGAVTGLPENGADCCIVSAMVLAACPGAVGVYAPDTGATAIRNEDGQVVAVMRLVKA